MPRYAAFLRGISPSNAKMPDLKRCFEDAGFANVQTVLASGNVVFETRASSEAALERKAEAAMLRELGRTFYTIVRKTDDLRRLLESDPFAALALPPAAKRVVSFLREERASKLVLPFEYDGARVATMIGREVFTYYVPGKEPGGFMRLIEKAVGKEVTTRTWETVKKVESRK
ncbi:MAG: DUF1697 domain-containing protein [Chthoniobacterales bacterium]